MVINTMLDSSRIKRFSKVLVYFFNDFQTNYGFTALIFYRGDGIFSLFILDHNGMEIDYPSAKKLFLAPVSLEGMYFK